MITAVYSLQVMRAVSRLAAAAAVNVHITVQRARREQLLRQYMHNTEIAVTMRLSTILKTIKQPL